MIRGSLTGVPQSRDLLAWQVQKQANSTSYASKLSQSVSQLQIQILKPRIERIVRMGSFRKTSLITEQCFSPSPLHLIRLIRKTYNQILCMVRRFLEDKARYCLVSNQPKALGQ
jgi:hypothetical protein